ncbi:MAG: DUF4340 domain-containing protein [Nevskiaceae bacterium]
MNRARLNMGLFAAAIGLGVAVFVAQKKEPPGPPLTPYPADAITRIALEHPGAPAIRLEKQDGRWRLVEPVQAEADEFEVNAVIGLADRETRLRLEAGALKELNLEPPDYTVTLNDRAIGFGGVEPLEYRRYVKTADGAFLIEDPPGAALDAEYADLVAKDLLPKDAGIERIEVPGVTLAQAADGKWTVTPASPKATADAMQKLADGWKNARSMWNEMARDAKVAGAVARVTLKGGATLEFVIVARDPQFKLHRADLGVTFVLSRTLVDELLKLPEPAAVEEEKK